MIILYLLEVPRGLDVLKNSFMSTAFYVEG
jgi:hypothetical protein